MMQEEWEGAGLRNNHCRCNNLYPMLGPETSESEYLTCVNTYWENQVGLAEAQL